jgi:serine/threonine protein kinase
MSALKEIGKYVIEKELGKGGMATVYLALHKDLGRQVALKIMHPHLACEEESRRRFELEAKAVAKLEHTNVVQIYDFGSHNDLFYIAMELVQGLDVEKLIKANGALPSEIAAVIVSGVAGGLASAHKNGIIHRDVKPANFIVKADGVVKLSDFGIVKMDGSASMTKSDSIVGTPYYIAPEQIEGSKASASSDIYALGVSMYYMLTGKYPYKSETLPLVLAAIAKGNYMPIREALPSISTEMIAIVEKMMHKDPQKRYTDSQQIVQDLNSFLYKRQVSADPLIVVNYFADPAGFSKTLRESGIRVRFTRARSYAEKGMVLEAFQELESILQEDPTNSDVKEELERLSDLRLTKTRSKIDGATMVISRPGKGNSLFAKGLFAAIAFIALVAIVWFLLGSNDSEIVVPAKIDVVDSSWKDSLLHAVALTHDTTPANIQTLANPKNVKPVIEQKKQEKKTIVEKDVAQNAVIVSSPDTIALQPSTCNGELSIASEFWGTVFVNGEKSGNAPTKLPMTLKCGDYVIRIETPAGKVAEKVIQVSNVKGLKARFRENDFK